MSRRIRGLPGFAAESVLARGAPGCAGSGVLAYFFVRVRAGNEFTCSANAFTSPR